MFQLPEQGSDLMEVFSEAKLGNRVSPVEAKAVEGRGGACFRVWRRARTGRQPAQEQNFTLGNSRFRGWEKELPSP